MKLLAAAITWLAIMAFGGWLLLLVVHALALTGVVAGLVAIGWGLPVISLATIAAIAIYETVE